MSKTFMIDMLDNGYMLTCYYSGKDYDTQDIKREAFIKESDLFSRIKEVMKEYKDNDEE